ncbi:hypothetical protein BC826DRAFT_973318 [Russula brevipes]|nr:hypothetical protein BC826DRAFT_973318 [Russula brevipes]
MMGPQHECIQGDTRDQAIINQSVTPMSAIPRCASAEVIDRPHPSDDFRFQQGALRVNEQDKFVRWGWPPWATFFQLPFWMAATRTRSTLKHFRNVSKFSIQASTSGPGFPSTTAAIETEKPPTPTHFYSRKISKMSNAEWYCTIYSKVETNDQSRVQELGARSARL